MKHLFFILTILLSKLTFGQTNPYSEVVNYYNAEKNFNGVVLVATNGQIDYLSGIGISNRQAGTNMNAKTKFKIASITKTFTAVLILQLYQQGKIDLKANFGKYYPNYKGEAKDKVTIEHLLTYSSGIPNSVDNLGMRPYQLPLTIDEFIDKYCSENLAFTPGEKSNYSNTEYTILHKIIENVSQKSFSSLLQENILNPLKMENTGLLNAKDIITGLTSSYTIQDSTHQITSDEPYFIENYFGSAAMYSTVEDLLKFNNAIFNYSLLNEPTTKLMLKPNEKLAGAALGGVWYADGYGTFNKPFIYRTGGLLGSCSNWIHSIEDKKTIIVFNNTDGTNLYEFSEQLYLVSTGQKATIPVIKKQENSSQAQNDAFTFEYKGKTQNLSERMEMKKVKGAHIQIYRNGLLDTTILMGYADAENKRKVTTETLFNVGDMSSAIGGFILLRAITQGKIQLNANVNAYLRSWKLTTPNNQIVTVEDLILNRPHFENVNKPRGYKVGKKVPTLLQTLNGEKPCKRKAIKLLAGENPDSFDAYSCLVLIQQLIEDIYQLPFAEVAQKEVLSPLNMTSSSYNMLLTPQQKAIAAVGYTHEGKRLKGDYRQYPEANASGLWTTPTDYATFVFHLLKASKGEDNRFISKELAQKAMQEQNGKHRTLLFGGGSGNNIYLGGASYGYRTQFQLYPDDNSMTVVFLNSFENWQFLNLDCLTAGEKYLKNKQSK